MDLKTKLVIKSLIPYCDLRTFSRLLRTSKSVNNVLQKSNKNICDAIKKHIGIGVYCYVDYYSLNGLKIFVEHFDKKSYYDKNYAMTQAAEGGHEDLVNFFIEKGANEWGYGLNSAIKSGNMNLVNFFIEKGASFHSLDKRALPESQKKQIKYFNQNLTVVAQRGHMNLVRFFIEKGANKFNNGFIKAAENGHIEIVKLLIQKGADQFNDGFLQAVYYGHTEIVKLLFERGDNKFNEALSTASYRGYKDIVEFLIEKGANNFAEGLINATDYWMWDIVKLLVQKRAPQGSQDKRAPQGSQDKRAPQGSQDKRSLSKSQEPQELWINSLNKSMHMAARKDNLEIIKFLIENGATDINKSINIAAENGHKDIVEYLFQKRSPFESQDDEVIELNITMYEAIYGRHFELVKYLFDQGADDIIGGLSHAAKEGSMDLVEFFIEKGSPNWSRSQFISNMNLGLVSAAGSGYLNLVEFFIEKGANNLKLAKSCTYRAKNKTIANYLDNLIKQRNN